MARRYKPATDPGGSDLEVLYPDRTARVSGSDWTVREYSLREAARLHSMGVQYAQSRDSGECHDVAALVYLLSVATGHDIIEIGGLPDEDFDRLVEAWEQVNLHLFDRGAHKPSGESVRWADLYATLIREGHTFADIGTYTARQIRLFYEAAQRIERHHRASRISDVSHGFAGGKHAQELIRKLQSVK